MFYGYSNVTIVFDSQRTEARRAEIERGKEQTLAICKGSPTAPGWTCCA